MKSKVRSSVATVAIGAVLIGGGLLIASPASAADEPKKTHVVLPLSAPTSMALAETLAKRTKETVVGYSYDNQSVSGQFYTPSPGSVEAFLSRFAHDFGTNPQITGVIVERVIDPSSGEPRGRLGHITVTEKPYKARAISPERLDKFRNATTESNAPDPAGRQVGGEWRPEVVDTEVVKAQPYVEFTQRLQWGDYSSPANVPENYGLETGVDLYNDEGDSVTPFCLPDNEHRFFAVRDSWMSFQVISFGQYAGSLQPYQDYTIGDSCSRAAFTVGLRYPQNVPADEDGKYALTIRITADEGDVAESRMSSDVTLLDDAKCRDEEAQGYTANLGMCMGYLQIEPDGVEVSRMVLNKDRAWMGPDRCWRSSGFGYDTALPLQTCGQAPLTHASLHATQIKVEDTDDRRILSITHDPTGYPYPLGSTPADSRFPYLSSALRENDAAPTDMRIWIDGVEQQVDFEEWSLEIPDDGDFLVLTNSGWGDVPSVGDGWRSTLAELADNGVIAFRIDNGPMNYLRLSGLGAQVEPHRATFATYPKEFDTGDYFHEAEYGEQSQVWLLSANATVRDGSEDESVLGMVPLSAFTVGPTLGYPGGQWRELRYEVPIGPVNISFLGLPTISGGLTDCVDDAPNFNWCPESNTIRITKIERLQEVDDEPDYWEMRDETTYSIDAQIFDFGAPSTYWELIDELSAQKAIIATPLGASENLAVYLGPPSFASRTLAPR